MTLKDLADFVEKCKEENIPLDTAIFKSELLQYSRNFFRATEIKNTKLYKTKGFRFSPLTNYKYFSDDDEISAIFIE